MAQGPAAGQCASDLARRVRVAGRALARADLVTAYGHCSARVDEDSFVVSPAKPLGLVAPGDACPRVAIAEPLPAGVAGEVRMHQAVYDRRPDVGGICRAQPARTMTLSVARTTPHARHGFSSYFWPAPPLWDDPALVRDEDAASKLAETLGDARAVVLRGNGALTVGTTIEEAVVLCWCLEDSARVELELLQADVTGVPSTELSAQEAFRRATWEGGLLERMWSYLVVGDPEAAS